MMIQQQAQPAEMVRKKELLHVLLKQLYEQSAEKQTFGDLIDNFISI